MSNQEILQKAIEKAIEGGWEIPDYLPSAEFLDEPSVQEVFAMNAPIVIFDHNFAKALWGGEVTQRPTEGGYEKLSRYKHHLQMMVKA